MRTKYNWLPLISCPIRNMDEKSAFEPSKLNKYLKEILSKGFIPKTDDSEEEFIRKYPNFDGRGILIAILDSGVDVSFEGMQQTSDCLPKIIDCFDFTGVGDVDTSTIKLTGNDNTLILLSGKEVKIPQNWKNPTNEWHLGIKYLKEIIPEKMLTKIDKSQSEKIENENPLNETETVNQKEDFENKKKDFIETISENDEKIDCIVWNDGKKWYACISLSSENLENEKVLTNFRDEHEYCFILDNISCCVTIQNDGNLLQLFTPYHEHGSLVAQVAAANFPSQPEKNGLAPGAQIVSMNIRNKGNNITNASKMEEALKKCIELGVDIVNTSTFKEEFNESAIINLIKKMVNKHGIIMIQSAGNFGPLISTVRYDTNGNDDEMLTIGSLLTFDTKFINEKEETDDRPKKYVWPYSSRGPLPNGARGVTLVAPSESVVEYPRWHPLKKLMFMGTSCASPNAAGASACLLSALKFNGIEYNPATIKMVLCNTAYLPDGEDRLRFGNGILQINSAFEYFKNQKDTLSEIKLPTISIKSKLNEKGIILYKLKNLSYINNYSIKIENNDEIQWILKLVPEDHQHVEYPKAVINNLFNIKINAIEMKPGNIYYSEIHGFDPKNLSLGPLFHLPVTVIVPENAINYSYEKKISVSSNTLFTLFVDPNKSCKRCMVTLCDPETGQIQFRNVVKKLNNNAEYRFTFTPTTEPASLFWNVKIRWNKVLEICIYQQIFIVKSFDLKTVLKLCFK